MSTVEDLRRSVWKNWYSNVSAEADLVAAATEDDVVAAVRGARRRGLGVRSAGTGHSNIALVPTDGVIITTDAMRGLLAHDSAAGTVTLAAGTKIRALGDMLWEHGLGLTNQGDIDTQAIAGAIATGTHGTGLSLKNLSSAVTAIRLVDARGDVRELGSDEHVMRAARVSMGMLGVWTSLQMKVSPAYHLHEWVGIAPIELVSEIEDEMNRRFRHFGYFWSPAGRRGAELMGLAPDQIQLDGDVAMLRIFDPEPIEVPELEAYTLRRRYDRSYRIFAEDYPPEFDEMEYMVPLERGVECWAEFTERTRSIFEESAIPAEVRVSAGDDNYLSEYEGGPRRAISLAGIMHADNSELFAVADAIFDRYDGRPHWAKANCMTADRLRRLYPRFEDFVSVRRAFDPDGVFLNDYLRRWFQ